MKIRLHLDLRDMLMSFVWERKENKIGANVIDTCDGRTNFLASCAPACQVIISLILYFTKLRVRRWRSCLQIFESRKFSTPLLLPATRCFACCEESTSPEATWKLLTNTNVWHDKGVSSSTVTLVTIRFPSPILKKEKQCDGAEGAELDHGGGYSRAACPSTIR